MEAQISSNTEALNSLVYLMGSFIILFAVVLWIRRKPRLAPKETSTTSPKISQPSSEEASIPSQNPLTSTKIEIVATPTSSTLSRPESRWWAALSKTRLKFDWNHSKSEIQEIKAALEEACLTSDLGVKNTEELLNKVNWAQVAQQSAETRIPQAKKEAASTLNDWLISADSLPGWPEKAIISDLSAFQGPRVIWFVGVNGVGKTTGIAKLASELKARGNSVLLAAGDTFRAAAGEQLEIWAQRIGIDCIKGAAGSDSSSVLFDAIKSAQAKQIDFVLCDSAGRLHNQSQLMEALAKNKRVMEKALPTAPHETLLVLDAHTGQNMLSQARQFHDSVKLTGLILTKLDGSARGGAVVAVAKELGLPIRRLGLGEGPFDFAVFEKKPFIDALLGTDQH